LFVPSATGCFEGLPLLVLGGSGCTFFFVFFVAGGSGRATSPEGTSAEVDVDEEARAASGVVIGVFLPLVFFLLATTGGVLSFMSTPGRDFGVVFLFEETAAGLERGGVIVFFSSAS